MRWIRSHIHLGSRLALFALAVQFVVSFGHVHFDGRTLTAAKSVATALLDGTRAKNPAAPTAPDKATDPGCAICALIQLASTSPPATAPTLPPLTAFVRIRPRTPDVVSFAASPHFSFQARAPPAA